MAQTEVTIRIRPNRAAVLIPDTASFSDMSLAVRFLSRIWGGRYCPILPVNPSGNDPRALRWLAETRPDYIFGLSVDTAVWHPIAFAACQHRFYEPLTPKVVESIHLPRRIELTTVIPVIRKRHLDQHLPGRRPLQFVRAEANCALAPYVSVVFGDSDPVWGNCTVKLPITEPLIEFTPEHGIAEFVRIVVNYSSGRHLSWLDFGSEEISTILIECMPTPPTIVAVESPLDLALAWNLRMTAGTSGPTWVIPLPVDALSESSVLDSLKEWIATVKRFGHTPTFCELVSLSVSEARLQQIAAPLRESLSSEGIQFVGAKGPYEEIATICCYERQDTVPVDLTGRVLTMTPFRPTLAEHMGRNDNWVVELLRDEREQRCVGDLCLPPRPCLQEILNIPAAPGLPSAQSALFGFGKGSLRAHCTMRSDTVRLCLPLAEEILEEVLIECGIMPIADEKRAAYMPALEKLGGMSKAAHHFRGRLRKVIRVLHDHESADLPTILREARLGRGELPDELSHPGYLDQFLEGYPDVAQRICRKRFTEYWQDYYPDDIKLTTLLELWSRLGLVAGDSGSYALDPQLRKAVGEGLIPVALTGEFLHGLTNEGFFWVPGVKYQRGTVMGDIDVMAICDGALVLAECKELESVATTATVWEAEVWPQFEQLIDTAKSCRADAVVLASLADAYPDGWEERASMKAGDGIGVLCLTRSDLNDGYRRLPPMGNLVGRRMFISDIAPNPRAPDVKKEPPGLRTITSPCSVARYGS